MPLIKLSELINYLYDSPIYNDPIITGLCLDSRKVMPGNLFFAVQGTHLDGRQFIDEAIKNGAAAVLAEINSPNDTFRSKQGIPVFPIDHLKQKIGQIASTFYGHPSKKLKIIGITGTNGKTSCSYFIAEALHQLKKKCGIIGTLGNGIFGNIKAGQLTTPDAIELHTLFAQFVAQKVTTVAMEVSSHSLDQGRVNGIEFEAGIFTNLTRDHLDYHGSMEDYGAAKRKLFDNPLTKNIIINNDDDFGKTVLARLKRQSIFTYGLHKNALIYADQVKLNHSGMSAQIFSPWGQGFLQSNLVGKFNLYNLLATFTALNILNFPFDGILKALNQVSSVPGRMQIFGRKNQPKVIVDYAHTPDALQKVLSALKSHCEGKLLCLFGCGGDRDRGKRPLMAKIAEQYADVIMLTDDNPRTEDSAHIISDILAGFTNPSKIIIEPDRSKAIQDIIQYATAGDCVLIAGKGAETYQLINDQKIPFSDIEKVREILE